MELVKNSKWMLPVALGAFTVAFLVVTALQISNFSDAVIQLASWILVLHVFVGEYVLIKYLHITSRNQRILDLFGFLLLSGGILSFQSPALWCAFLAGVMALATMKYVLIEANASLSVLKRYAREKIRWEAPSVVLFLLLALIIEQLPAAGLAVRVIEIGVLALTAAFAVWMIWIRHIYRWVSDAAGE